MAPAPEPEPSYRKDEKVYCFHHELLYEAKVIEVQAVKADDKSDKNDKKSGWQYKIHYKGWKNTWDDWVSEDRLRKLSPENRELSNNLRHEMLLQQRAARAQPLPAKKKAHGSARGSEERQTSVSAAAPRGQKRMRDNDIEKEEVFQNKRAVRIYMPDRLKSLLVDDWENITKSLQLVQLPSTKPAATILDEYSAWAVSTGNRNNTETDILEEVVAGLKEYFNKSLGRLLLYRFEREQFFDIYTRMEQPTDELAGKTLAEIYGGEHLLRLLVSMPELIAQTNMDVQAVNRLREELSGMTTWLAKEPQVNAYFASVYESPGQAYIDKVKSST
ncbi:mortality factor 4-like protein-like protein 1 [Dothidotthia symphoricarpi CBS 119687]|uniref:Chromatin modification-related protein EAF3 n=1 Tax=Dothidotthia symphoricarpi CBS 119687 TaxID=1392245 RepID=A0A6A6AIS7_9PLEO|nr:mortality factor 4-like protein-like protein 1 [Dothidotthia symphoricarpi CBS 119687]KAF2130817.1 mortality factor 4-like protein-like protein 1 [Dothidotthia symphoricarpi CBS 119687]